MILDFIDPQPILDFILEAFKDVPKGEMSIFETVELAGWEAKEKEEPSKHWSEVSSEILSECLEGLLYLEAVEFKYYLPAFMTWAIKNREKADEDAYYFDYVYGSLSYYEEPEMLAYFEQLDDAQFEAVYYFLRYMAKADPNVVDVYLINDMIQAYWKKCIPSINQRVVEKIAVAFDGVPKGKMTIHEAEAKDDYRDATPEEKRLEASKRWQEVKEEHIIFGQTALSHFDPASWKYYLPAYMTWTLLNINTRENVGDSAKFTLQSDSNYMKERFESLNATESEAAACFVYFMANVAYWDINFEEQLMLDYWNKYT